MPSSSIITQFTKAQNSSSVCQSRPLRASRDASIANTAPAVPGADRHEQTLEAGTRLTITRPAEIIVDNNDVLPAECARPCRQAVLSTAALGVVEQLIRL